MNEVKVKSIDVYGIEERLRKDKSKEGVEVWQYVKALKEAHERQKDLTAKAIGRLTEYAASKGKIEGWVLERILFFLEDQKESLKNGIKHDWTIKMINEADAAIKILKTNNGKD